MATSDSQVEEVTESFQSASIGKDPIFDLIKGKEADALAYLAEGKLKQIDCADENGMTPLQHASYRGFKHACEKLIEKGANVNSNTHDQGYTALMFAAISNNTDVVRLLLQHDANIDTKNKIGRTASQMASFVNSTESVDIINNYISKSDIEYYTKIHSPKEQKPKLPDVCVNDLHDLLTSTNYSPIFILKKLSQKPNIFLTYLNECINTLGAFIEKSFKRDNVMDCPNDILSFKLHYYKFILEYVKKSYEKSKKPTFDNEQDEANFYKKFFETVAKQFITEEVCSETQKPFRSFEEKFLRELIRQFPYKECALLRQMVQIIAKIRMGWGPTALYVITSCLNGQKFKTDNDGDDENEKKIYSCSTCDKRGAMLCSRCKKTAYCDQFCQRINWGIHKKDCNVTNTVQ